MSTADVQPMGTVTFLFTDVAGSTAMWDADAESARAALIRHDAIVENAVVTAGGVVVKPRGEGDSHFAVFDQALAGVTAALAISQALRAVQWTTPQPLEVRMALHTGIADMRGGDYYGPDVNRCARLRAAGHAGQILLSGAAAALVRTRLPADAGLIELGRHRLRDVATSEDVFQLSHPDLPADFPPLATADRRRHNLPPSLTTFVGRDAERAALQRLVGSTRLLTLLGAGGVGKSRLALEVAADLLPVFPDGVFDVDLATLTDPALVGQQVLSAVGVQTEPGRQDIDTLLGYLARRHLLLLLDGCEHLNTACGALAEAVLRECPNVSIVATSREPLHIHGEVTWRVPSLTVPPSAEEDPAQPPAAYDAVQLFIDRAKQNNPGFSVGPGDAAPVAQICQRLGGIPLAIELAATKVKVLSCEQIAARLDNRFRLLTGGARNALARHQTLRAAVDWSFELLSDEERALFRRLAVFPGGFTLDAVEAICSGPDCDLMDILDRLGSLVDKSLVAVEESSRKPRFRLLETLRQYGRELLRDNAEDDELHQRMLAWCLAQAERAEPELKGPEQGAFLDLLEDEHDNFRFVLGWAQEHGAGADGLRLSVELSRFWLVRGYLSEGRHWLESALAANPAAPERDVGRALIAASTLAWHQGDYQAVAPLAQRALGIFQALGDKVGIAEALCRLGELATMTGDHAAAWDLFEQSRAAWAESGAKRGVIQSMNVPLHDLGTIACERGDFAAARALFDEALTIAREHGNTMDIVHHLSGLGHVERGDGDYAAARALYEDSQSRARTLGYKRMVAFNLQYLGALAWADADLDRASTRYREALAYFGPAGDDLGIVRCLEGLAKVAATTGDLARAASLAGAAEDLRDQMRSPMPPSETSDYDAALRTASDGLGEHEFALRKAEGKRAGLQSAVRAALREAPAGEAAKAS